jgi:general secretion pathway protein J
MSIQTPTQRGFTLLELLISLAIFALISAITFTGLQSSLESRERTEAQGNRLVAVQKAFNFMRQDFEQAVPRSVRDQLGDRDPKNAFQQVLDGIVFTRGGRDNPLGLRRSNLERLGYGIEEGKLVRKRWQALDQPPEPAVDAVPLLDEVKALTFRFLGPDKQWVDQWPPVNTTNPDPELPHAVEVTLELTDIGTINRMFLLPH